MLFRMYHSWTKEYRPILIILHIYLCLILITVSSVSCKYWWAHRPSLTGGGGSERYGRSGILPQKNVENWRILWKCSHEIKYMGHIFWTKSSLKINHFHFWKFNFPVGCTMVRPSKIENFVFSLSRSTLGLGNWRMRFKHRVSIQHFVRAHYNSSDLEFYIL